MDNFSLPEFARVISKSAVLLSISVAGAAFAQTPEQFTVDRTVKFVAGTDKERAQWRKIPAAREIIEGEFAAAKEDLDGDGKPELILLARSASLCRDGGCPLLVLRRTAEGIEPLLAAKVSGKLALTKERVEGYRALALLDGTGRIAIGNRSSSPLFGKQVVYQMRTRAQAPTGSAASEAATAQGPATRAGANSASLELAEFIRLFMQPQAGPATPGDWTFGAKNGSPISWQTSGVQEASPADKKAGYPYRRTGKVILTLDGKPTHQNPEQNVVPGTWTITLSGPRGGFTRATLSARIADGSVQLLEGLSDTLPVRHYRCKTPSVSSGNKVFAVQEKGKNPFWINEEWSCGSAGCGLMLDFVFTKKEADKFECF